MKPENHIWNLEWCLFAAYSLTIFDTTRQIYPKNKLGDVLFKETESFQPQEEYMYSLEHIVIHPSSENRCIVNSLFGGP